MATTKTYRIVSSQGVDFGLFDGADEAEALDALARDAGYRDQAHAELSVGPFEGRLFQSSPEGWREHDHVSPHSTCRRCGLTLGDGIDTEWDAAWSESPDDCPRCGGEMGLVPPEQR